jgi:hypothetical protein
VVGPSTVAAAVATTADSGGVVAKLLAKGSRITGAQRGTLAAQYAKRYAAGESIRKIAEDVGRSFGFVHGVLKEAGVILRSRGGATRGAKATGKRAASARAAKTATKKVASAAKTPTTKPVTKKAPTKSAARKDTGTTATAKKDTGKKTAAKR